MATPFFRGNYGSALSRVDTRPIIEAGRARGQMFANMGAQVGGMIKEYGLNKEKRQVMTDKIEGTLNLYPEYAVQLTSSGDETSDKKNQTTLDKLAKGELGLSALQGLAEKLSMMELKDLKDQQEKIASQNARLLQANIAKTEQATKTAQELAAIQKRDQGLLDDAYKRYDTRIHNILSKAQTNPDFDIKNLSVEDQKLFINYDLVQTRQMPLEKLITMPDEEVDLATARQGFKNAVQDFEKTKQEIKRTKGQMEDEETARMVGDYPTIEDVNKELTSLADKGTLATAIRNKNGGYTITNIRPIRKQDLTEFNPDEHPGILADMNGNLFRTNKQGELISIGGDKNAQREGQKLDYLRMRERGLDTDYMNFKNIGKLVDRGNVYDSEPNENTNPDNLYYLWDGKYRKFSQKEEDAIRDYEILRDSIEPALFPPDVDLTTP